MASSGGGVQPQTHYPRGGWGVGGGVVKKKPGPEVAHDVLVTDGLHDVQLHLGLGKL